MKSSLTSLLTLVLCWSLLAGCSPKKVSPLVGKWQDAAETIEFTGDGKMSMHISMSDDSMNGTYTLPDDDHFTMILGGLSKTLSYKIDGDALTADDNGRKMTLKRVK